jgi:hypothetical protein
VKGRRRHERRISLPARLIHGPTTSSLDARRASARSPSRTSTQATPAGTSTSTSCAGPARTSKAVRVNGCADDGGLAPDPQLAAVAGTYSAEGSFGALRITTTGPGS